MKDIITKDREEFLQAEKEWFKFYRSLQKFKKDMESELRTCKNCGVYYWNGCLKRCKC
jgi:hypothetical protein